MVEPIIYFFVSIYLQIAYSIVLTNKEDPYSYERTSLPNI